MAALSCEEPGSVSKKRKRKRKREERDTGKGVLVQLSPFKPSGKFKTCQTLDTSYSVKPSKQWTGMTRYNNFVLNNIKYHSGDFAYVNNEKSVERQEAVKESAQYQAMPDPTHCWVAKILEIRASDEQHVYARIYWMYYPDELPPNTYDNGEIVSGRQPYHGENELIASNHMDVLNVVSVAMRAVVHQSERPNDGPNEHALYWRQALDVSTLELSLVD
jgi:hypothetical protein